MLINSFRFIFIVLLLIHCVIFNPFLSFPPLTLGNLLNHQDRKYTLQSQRPINFTPTKQKL
eukprot:m.7861 g.7861  ORF g.7861 m.7861 type:complete len:61 (+) comp2935_c0_seq1:21-203(+)